MGNLIKTLQGFFEMQCYSRASHHYAMTADAESLNTEHGLCL